MIFRIGIYNYTILSLSTFKLKKNEALQFLLQVGGAPSQNILSGAMSGIQEALKNSDWTTRKAASVALGDIAATGGSILGSFRSSSIRSLDSCRFDKVCVD